jgi:hypothetical protein
LKGTKNWASVPIRDLKYHYCRKDENIPNSNSKHLMYSFKLIKIILNGLSVSFKEIFWLPPSGKLSASLKTSCSPLETMGKLQV